MHSRQEKMPIDRQRYPNNWSDIALSIKEAASWRCRHCGKQCLRPGDQIQRFNQIRTSDHNPHRASR